MATPEQVAEVRVKTNEHGSDPYDDDAIAGYVDGLAGNTDLAAARIWREKAARYADLVDTSEAGASRKLGQMYEHAVKQAAFYEVEGGKEEPAQPAQVSVIRRVS